MKDIKATVSGHEYTLRFSMATWEKIEDDVCPVDDLGDKLAGRGRIRAIIQVFAILAGVDPDEIRNTAEPSDLRGMMQAIWKAINTGMKMTTQPGDDREVDVTLEEIEKKEEPGA